MVKEDPIALHLVDYCVGFDLNKHVGIDEASDDRGHGNAHLSSVFGEHSREGISDSLYVFHVLDDDVSEERWKCLRTAHRQEHSDSYDILCSFGTNRFDSLDDLCKYGSGLLTGVPWM